jgi:REP element-mobilizing transposase RayT
MPKVGTQLEIAAVVDHVQPPRWGGRREGAGRKRVAPRPCVEHRPRPVHKRRHPVHVTLRARPGLPSFRAQRVSDMLRTILWRQRKRRYRNDFQVVEFSIQDNHLHMIVEASGSDMLRSGVSGLVIAFAKRLNKMLSRKGKVWGDRWHGRELHTPQEVRNALVYVFRNLAKHGRRIIADCNTEFADAFSSAWRFRHFTRPVGWFPELGTWPEARPRTWLLGVGWHTVHGPIDTRETMR